MFKSLLIVPGCALLLSLALLGGPVAHADMPTPFSTPMPAPSSLTPTPSPSPTVVLPPVATVTKLSATQVHAATGGTVLVYGTGLDQVTQVTVAGQAATVTPVNPTEISLMVGGAPNFQAQLAPIVLTDYYGRKVMAGTPFNYVITNRVDQEMAYAGSHYQLTKSATFGFIKDNDCTNYTSQLLFARGWHMTDTWYNQVGAGDGMSGTWSTATAMAAWLRSQPNRVDYLSWGKRSQVQVGDVVAFNWNWSKKSGNTWDHLAVISKVVTLPDGTKDFYYTAHTYPRLFGGSVGVLRNGYKHLRVMFFHLH